MGTRHDVREDEEAQEYYEKVLDLLLAAGYFRARISGLSPFDKVIGGLAWAITGAAGDVDVDIFFQENAQIGQKIVLAEQCVAGLKRLGCALPLQSFQIQGSDWKSIFPVVQWLVTKVMEVRAETGDLVRAYSEAQFAKEYHTPLDDSYKLHHARASSYTQDVAHVYRPKRQFVNRAGTRGVDVESERVALVLLEYGSRSNVQVSNNKAADAEDEKAVAAAAAAEEAAYQRRMQRLATLGEGGDVSDSALSGFLANDKLQAMLDDYESGMGRDGDGPIAGVQGKRLAERQHANAVAALEERVAQLKVAGKKLQAQHAEAKEAHEALSADVAQKRAFTARLQAAIAELDAMETDENRPVLNQLKRLVWLNEALRQQEADFRRSCAAEMTRLKELIAQAEINARNAADANGQAEREALLKDAEAKDAKKRSRVENALAERRCAVAAAERKLDSMPSRVELQQYQRQFVELYEQIEGKVIELRRYYNTYNTLEDTRTFLNRETEIYESILAGYKSAMGSKSSRAKFGEEMAMIVKGVNDSLDKVESKLDTEVEQKRSLEEQYKALVEKQRTYFALARTFQQACEENEALERAIERAAAH